MNAQQFLDWTGSTLSFKLGNEVPKWLVGNFKVITPSGTVWVKHGRHWVATLTRGQRSFTFDYWESVNDLIAAYGGTITYEKGTPHTSKWVPTDKGEPSASAILDFDPDCNPDFADWAEDLGYNTDSIKARDIWRESLRHTAALHWLYTHEELEAFTNLDFF